MKEASDIVVFGYDLILLVRKATELMKSYRAFGKKYRVVREHIEKSIAGLLL